MIPVAAHPEPVHVNECMRVCICVCLCMYAFLDGYEYDIRRCTCGAVMYVCVNMYVCMYVCIYVCVCMPSWMVMSMTSVDARVEPSCMYV